MNVSSITEYINRTYADIHPLSAWGETSFFYNPDRKLARGIYFATIKEKDGKNVVHPIWIEPMFFALTSASQKGPIDPSLDHNHPGRWQVVSATRDTTSLYWIN